MSRPRPVPAERDVERWEGLLERAGLDDPGHEVLGELVERYGEDHRAYHDLHHVHACLDLLDEHRDRAEKPEATALALWFHDAVYGPLRSDNERASAELASWRLEKMGAAEELVDEVEALILLTAHGAELEGPPPADADLLLDVDLAILGAEREVYEAYELAIRREFRVVPTFLFRRGRRSVLRSFLQRRWIYRTEPFRDQREERARENLEWAIRRLEE